MAKTNPDRTVENVARAAGANVQVMWIMNGPKDTHVACIECLLINKGIVLIETFVGGGWDAFTGATTNDRDMTIADVLNRCAVPVPDDLGTKYEVTFIGHLLGKNDPSIEHTVPLKGPVNLHNVEARLYDAGWAVNSVKNIGAPA